MTKFVLAAAMLASAATAGPLSKFESRRPVAEYVSSAALEEIERCLMDMDGQLYPEAIRQPDRPDDVILLWPNGQQSGVAFARLDLHRVAGGTRVRSWMPARQALDCAPRRG